MEEDSDGSIKAEEIAWQERSTGKSLEKWRWNNNHAEQTADISLKRLCDGPSILQNINVCFLTLISAWST